jgi:hypothetical protein
MFSRAMFCFALFAILAVVIARPATVIPIRQQLVFQGLVSLSSGDRVGVFLPNIPVALGMQSRSGPRALIIGDLVSCRPFEENTKTFRETANGIEPFSTQENMMNCGPVEPGGEDRIFAVVGIQWRAK